MSQAVVDGCVLSANYALIALGITLIFSIMNLLNFAHGQMFMVGGFMVYYVYGVFHLPFAVGLVVAAVLVGLIGARLRAFPVSPRAADRDARGVQHAARGRHRAAARKCGPVDLRR